MLPIFYLNIIVFLVTLCLLVIYWNLFKRDSKIEEKLNKLPGPPTLPLIGNLMTVLIPTTEIIGMVHELVKKHGRIIRLWMGNRPYVLLVSAKDVEKVLSSIDHIDRSREYQALRPWLGDGLNVANGHAWLARRKMLNPAFTFQSMDNFLHVFNEQSVIMKNVLEKECVDRGIINLFPYCCRCALDVVCEAAMGTKIEAQTHQDLDYLKATVAAAKLICKRMLRPWLQPNFIWNLSSEGRAEKKHLKVLHGFTENVLMTRKNLLENKLLENSSRDVEDNNDINLISPKKPRLALLDMLLEISKGGTVLTDLQIRNEADAFMVAGHDSSGAGIAWTLFLLALNPEIQRKVQSELDDIFEEDRDRHATTSDLSRMKYLELCVKETLRLCPPIPVIFRLLNQDLILADGRIVPGGTSVAISLLELQRDPEVFPNPMKYDPNRFLPENCKGRNPYAYIPFAIGPRNCIAIKFAQMELKVILSTLLRNYSFETTGRFEDVKINPDVALRPLDGLHFVVKNRI